MTVTSACGTCFPVLLHGSLVPPKHINVISTSSLQNHTPPGEKGWKHKWVRSIHFSEKVEGSSVSAGIVIDAEVGSEGAQAFLPLSQCSGRAARGFFQQKSLEQCSQKERQLCPGEQEGFVSHGLEPAEGTGNISCLTTATNTETPQVPPAHPGVTEASWRDVMSGFKRNDQKNMKSSPPSLILVWNFTLSPGMLLWSGEQTCSQLLFPATRNFLSPPKADLWDRRGKCSPHF